MAPPPPQKIQDMEERRIIRIGESMKTFAEVDRQVMPIIGKCLDEITKAVDAVDPKHVSGQLPLGVKSKPGFQRGCYLTLFVGCKPGLV